MMRQDAFVNYSTPEMYKFITILTVSAVTGLLAVSYSPTIILISSIGFAAATVMLYVKSRSSSQISVLETATLIDTVVQHRLLFFLCAISFFLSVTIPKSGKTISSVPVTVANLCILCAFVIWGIKFLFLRKTLPRIPLYGTMLLFIAYGVINAMLGLVYHNPIKQILIEFSAFFGFIPVYFLICSVVQTRRRLMSLTTILVLSLFLVCLYGVLQVQLGFERVAVPGITEQYGMIKYAEFGGRWNYLVGGRQKLYSTFQNGNIFGNHLATFLPLLGGIILAMQTRWKKMLCIGLFLLTCYTLYLTYSRGALVGAIFGVVVLALVAKKHRRHAIGVLSVMLIALVIVINQYADRPESARYNFRKLSESPDQFSAGRIQRIQYIWNYFKTLPFSKKLLGIGLGGNMVIDNLYLFFLIRFGLVGISIFLCLLLRFFLTLLQWRSNITDMTLQGMMNGGIAGLSANLVHNIADVLWLFPPLAANFWFLAGMTACIGLLGTPQPLQQKVILKCSNAK